MMARRRPHLAHSSHGSTVSHCWAFGIDGSLNGLTYVKTERVVPQKPSTYRDKIQSSPGLGLEPPEPWLSVPGAELGWQDVKDLITEQKGSIQCCFLRKTLRHSSQYHQKPGYFCDRTWHQLLGDLRGSGGIQIEGTIIGDRHLWVGCGGESGKWNASSSKRIR